MSFPVPVKTGSNKKVSWSCECGRTALISVHSVTSGASTSCGRCSTMPAEYWRSTTFGRLSMKEPKDSAPMSSVPIAWSCSCGGEVLLPPIRVVSGNTKSCGKCRSVVRARFAENRERIRSLRSPISGSDVPDGLPLPVTPILNVSDPFEAICPVCHAVYRPRWDGIRLGKGLTCGCSSDRVSSPQREIYEYVVGLGVEAVLEGKIGSLSYDVVIPGMLAVEMHGIRWHSMLSSKERDLRKRDAAVRSGLRYLCIYEDEWRRKRGPMESILSRSLGRPAPSKALRPVACDLTRPSTKAVRDLYDRHHYIGWCGSEVSYGLEHEGRLLACASFSRPKRQSSHRWEIVRMASDPAFTVHGAWGKIFSHFVADTNPESVVSFSDNRLFTGSVYEKLGFVLDGEVRPDYYWVIGSRRVHKSSLRKTIEERMTGRTEAEIREGQGYRKIWDCGKKRWVWRALAGLRSWGAKNVRHAGT
jgi:hypothetical protein